MRKLRNYLTRRGRLALVNDGLTLLVVLVALYIIGLPFLPAIGWWTQHEAPVISSPPHVTLPKKIPAGETLIIPSLGMTETIHEGQSLHTLHYGVWHLPDSSTPDKGGNTVMAGHRFTYAGPAVFYHLDKVKIGDKVYVYWNHKQYNYRVDKVLVVLPTDVAVEAPTKQPQLTIYTCTPMWSTTHRLVIEAKPVEKQI